MLFRHFSGAVQEVSVLKSRSEACSRTVFVLCHFHSGITWNLLRAFGKTPYDRGPRRLLTCEISGLCVPV